MDPNATLRLIGESSRIDRDTSEAMANLYSWLSRGGFAPNWSAYPKATKRFRRVYGSVGSK